MKQKIFYFPYFSRIAQLEEKLVLIVEDGYRIVQFQVIPHTILGDHNVVSTEYSMLVVAEQPAKYEWDILSVRDTLEMPVLVGDN